MCISDTDRWSGAKGRSTVKGVSPRLLIWAKVRVGFIQARASPVPLNYLILLLDTTSEYTSLSVLVSISETRPILLPWLWSSEPVQVAHEKIMSYRLCMSQPLHPRRPGRTRSRVWRMVEASGRRHRRELSKGADWERRGRCGRPIRSWPTSYRFRSSVMAGFFESKLIVWCHLLSATTTTDSFCTPTT
ncbi:hypothetical protein PENSPDRAFT_124933 [Peniophora sp. CONT]|nr:hypothetical protein PENSPDRAFT_124933 [Peniophora sp. CONT]